MYAEYCAWRGIRARSARGAGDAVRELAASLPDGVVVSERLRDCTGPDLVRALRRSRRTFDLPVVMLASNTSVASLYDTSKYGCDLVLTVPVLPDELIDALEAVMRLRAARRFDAWLFSRGGESVWMVRTARLELAVAGPREHRQVFHFETEPELASLQADYQRRLQSAGYALDAFGTDRRLGRERRVEARPGVERRLAQ
jgi:DNA-binding response OmpR family regulator